MVWIWVSEPKDPGFMGKAVEEKTNVMSQVFFSAKLLSFLQNLRPDT